MQESSIKGNRPFKGIGYFLYDTNTNVHILFTINLHVSLKMTCWGAITFEKWVNNFTYIILASTTDQRKTENIALFSQNIWDD